MKKLLALFLATLMLFSLVSCSKNQGTNEIHYSVNQGVKIEKLSEKDQELIDRYVSDCKILYAQKCSEDIKNRDVKTVYLAFNDVFVYDFRGLDETNLNEGTEGVWNVIKQLRNGATPIFYIELKGYNSYYNSEKTDNKISCFEESPYPGGFFVYEDNIVINYPYRQICNLAYQFAIPTDTKTINCGNKYAEELTKSDLQSYNETPKILNKYKN